MTEFSFLCRVNPNIITSNQKELSNSAKNNEKVTLRHLSVFVIIFRMSFQRFPFDGNY